MTKLREPDLFPLPLLKNLPAPGRDDSPVSVIANSAVISHPSSACASMEHHICRDAKVQELCHEHEYPTSEDDGIGNDMTLSQEFLKATSLESLPETRSFLSRVFHSKQLLEEPHQKVELSFATTSDNNGLSSETDSTASGPEVSDESSGEHFSGLLKEDGEASTYFSPFVDGTVLQEKKMVIKPNFTSNGWRLIHEEIGAKHEDQSAKLNHSEWRQQETSAYGQSKVSVALSKPIFVSKELHRNDRQQLKLTDPSVSIKKLVEGEECPLQQNALQEGVAKTASSPGLGQTGSSFPGAQNLGGSQTNRGVLDAWRVSSEAASKPGSVRALPNYVCDAGGRGCMSRTLPSKWEDAEKWLVSVDSPSHTQIRTAVAPSKAFQYPRIPPVNRTINTALQRPAAFVPGEKSADYSFSYDENVGATLKCNQSATAAASDSELPKAVEYRALVRSGSQKHRRQQNSGGSSCGRDATREEVLLKLRSYGGQEGNGTPTVISDSRNILGMEASFSDARKERWGSLRPCNVHGVRAFGGAIGKPTFSFPKNDDVGERFIVLQQAPALNENLTQDKYADTVIKTLGHGGAPNSLAVCQEYINMQTSRCALSAFMKDASTEISPAVSRRDMATQVTPQPSSRTSACTTPVKNNSPARHNTPARRSASWSNTAGFNLLELESCHLAKLELRDLPVDIELHPFDTRVSAWSTREEEEDESSACLRPPEVPDIKFNLLEARASAWEDAERAKFTAKYKREEARIDAWENLQRAKAEAEIKKLEVKLENLRSQGTEKIMNKLKVALRRAQEMRAASEVQQVEQLAKIAERATNIRKNGHFSGNFGVCFAGIA